jgi:hypothetical protein
LASAATTEYGVGAGTKDWLVATCCARHKLIPDKKRMIIKQLDEAFIRKLTRQIDELAKTKEYREGDCPFDAPPLNSNSCPLLTRTCG